MLRAADVVDGAIPADEVRRCTPDSPGSEAASSPGFDVTSVSRAVGLGIGFFEVLALVAALVLAFAWPRRRR